MHTLQLPWYLHCTLRINNSSFLLVINTLQVTHADVSSIQTFFENSLLLFLTDFIYWMKYGFPFLGKTSKSWARPKFFFEISSVISRWGVRIGSFWFVYLLGYAWMQSYEYIPRSVYIDSTLSLVKRNFRKRIENLFTLRTRKLIFSKKSSLRAEEECSLCVESWWGVLEFVERERAREKIEHLISYM